MIPATYWSPTRKLMLLGAMAGGKAVEMQATGNPLTFVTDLARPLKSLLIPFTPQQEGTGNPSPENIRSIVPWNGVTVFGGGKNLLKLAESEMISSGWYRIFPNPLKKAGTYTVSCTNVYGGEGNKGARLVLTDSQVGDDEIQTLTGWQFGRSAPATKTFTISEDGAKAKYLCFQCESKGCTFASIEEAELQIEVGQTATTYEPYSPITETDIVFPSAVYGGTLDVVSGVLTVTHEGLVSTWGQAKVDRKQSGYQQGRIFFTHDVPVSGQSGASATNQKCNIAKYQWDDFNGTPHFYTGTLDGKNCAVILIPEDTPDETEIVVSAKLRTTYEIQLTPAQIKSLVGNNTIWSDADGSLTAVYLKKG